MSNKEEMCVPNYPFLP